MDIIGEEEITKVMQLVVMIAEKQGISTKDDPQLLEMLKPTDRETIELMLEKQVG